MTIQIINKIKSVIFKLYKIQNNAIMSLVKANLWIKCYSNVMCVDF